MATLTGSTDTLWLCFDDSMRAIDALDSIPSDSDPREHAPSWLRCEACDDRAELSPLTVWAEYGAGLRQALGIA